MARREILETTLGDLIVALTDETAPCVRDEGEVNRVVAYILADLLYNSGRIYGDRAVTVKSLYGKKSFVVH
jgi:hypothetical protein